MIALDVKMNSGNAPLYCSIFFSRLTDTNCSKTSYFPIVNGDKGLQRTSVVCHWHTDNASQGTYNYHQPKMSSANMYQRFYRSYSMNQFCQMNNVS